MAKVYEQAVRIRWNHCDPAGIVYHPQYLVLVNNLMEDFFRECTPMSYGDMMRERCGFPIVGIRCDFCAPSRFGDECTMRLWVESIGTTSVRFAVTLYQGEECRLKCVETAVYVAAPRKNLEKAEIPAAVRAAFEAYLADADTPKLELRA